MIVSIYYVVECQHRHLRADAATLRRLHHELATGCSASMHLHRGLPCRPAWGGDRQHQRDVRPRPTPRPLHAHAHAHALPSRLAPFPAPRPEPLAPPRHPSPLTSPARTPAPPRRASPHPHRHAAIRCCMTSRALTPALALPLTRCFMVSTACLLDARVHRPHALLTQASYPYPMPLPLPLIAALLHPGQA